MESRIAIAVAILVMVTFAIALVGGKMRTLNGSWDRREDPGHYWAALGGSAIGFAFLVWQYLTH